MQSGFTTGTRASVLFPVWDIGTYAGLVLAMLFCVVGSLLIECIQVKLNRSPNARQREKYASTQDLRPEISSNLMDLREKIGLTFFHMIRAFLGYCLMLFAMSYNIWIYASIIVGAGLGYFFLKQYKPEKATAHAQNDMGEHTEMLPRDSNVNEKNESLDNSCD